MSRLHPTLQEPDIHIDDAVLNLWKQDQLADAEALLTAAIPTSWNTRHHVLASRALVRTRLRQWDAAITDAKDVISVLLHGQMAILIYISPSRFSHPSLDTLQRV